MRVLVIDDDDELAQAMRQVLATYSVTLDWAATPERGLQMLQEERPYDLLLLDIMLPEINGFEMCRRIRSSPEPLKDIPIIMLTARGDLTDLVVGLEVGADDYVTKPFEPRELVARIHAVQRRAPARRAARAEPPSPAESASMCFQLDGTHLVIDTDHVRVRVGERPLALTSMEYELLVFLAKEPGHVFGRDDLIFALQGVSHLSQRSIDALVYRLRMKMRSLDPRAGFIRTIRGRGYSLIGQRVPAETASSGELVR